ncbi:MAG: DUF4097 family beta strand repeat-containing protein [Acidimicrobiales bacterium]
MEWSFVAVGPVKADVEVPAGRVELQAVARDEVRVALEPRGSASRRATELIEASRVSLDDGRLTVHVPSRSFKNVELLCTVVLPEGSCLAVKTASADVHCPGRLGDFKASVASADVTLGTVDGNVVLATASGDLCCESVGARLEVKGASADVTVSRARGPVEIALVSGDVRIAEADSSLRLDTASGDLRLGCAHEGEITANSASGDMRIGVAAGVGAYLDVSSLSGEMTCTLPVKEVSPPNATLRITCRTLSGDVRVESAAS